MMTPRLNQIIPIAKPCHYDCAHIGRTTLV